MSTQTQAEAADNQPHHHLKYTRWARRKIPKWATRIDAYDTLCECEALPVIAKYVIEIELPRNQGIRKLRQQACPVCLNLLAAERGEYDAQEANNLYDSLQPPERDNGAYALRRVFDDYSKARLSYWKEAGLVLSSRSLVLNGRHPTPTVDYKNLIAFMRNPDSWHLWRAESVLDLELRTWITLVRDTWPWRWYTTRETAKLLGYALSTVQGYSRLLQGKIGPRPTRRSKGGKGFFYRSDAIEWFKDKIAPTLYMGGAPYEVVYGEPFLHVETCLPKSYRDEIAALGGKNFSGGVRRLLEWWREFGAGSDQGQGIA